MSIGNLNSEADLLAFMDVHRFNDLSAKVTELRSKVIFVDGAPPAFTKNGSALCLRNDPSVGASGYVWNGASWVAVA